MANDRVLDYTQNYQNILPAEIKTNLKLYVDLLAKLDEVQEKLEKNFYRVTDINKLKDYVDSGRLKVAKYSIIEETNGSYRLVKFNDFFADEFRSIVKLLNKLEEKVKNTEYKDYISSLAIAYQNNNFIDPYKKWVLLGSKLDIDFIYFPTEPYLDKVFETILSFEGHLKFSVNTEENLDVEQTIRSVIDNTPYFSDIHKSIDLSTLTLRADYTALMSGATLKLGAIGQNLPNEREFVKLWGTKSSIHKTQIDKQIKDEYFPLTEHFENGEMSIEEYADGMTRVLFTHEVTEALMKFEGDEDRLKDKYLSIRELNSDASGIKNYVLYLIKGHDNDQKIKNMVYFHVLSLLRAYVKFGEVENPMQHYYGYIFTFNYLLENGSITINSKDKIEIDIKKTLKSISDISNQTTSILIKGTYSDAVEYLKPYVKTDTLKRLLKR